MIILHTNWYFSPGVIITEIHKRGGMDEEAYQKVIKTGGTVWVCGTVWVGDRCNILGTCETVWVGDMWNSFGWGLWNSLG